MTFSTQLSVHLGTLPLLLHRCTDSFKIRAQIYVTLVVCLGCRYWAWRINMCLMFFLVIDVNIVFIEVMILFCQSGQRYERSWNPVSRTYHIYIYIIHMYAVVFQCSDRWQLFCLAPSWCLLTVHKRSWLEGQEMSKRPQLVRGHEYLASWKWNWRISFTIIILQGVSHIITGNLSLP